jgi:hypothetical protein
MKELSENPKNKYLKAANIISKAHLRAVISLSHIYSLSQFTSNDANGEGLQRSMVLPRGGMHDLVAAIFSKVQTSEDGKWKSAPDFEVPDRDVTEDCFERWSNFSAWDDDDADAEESLFSPSSADSSEEKDNLVTNWAWYKTQLNKPFTDRQVPSPSHLASQLLIVGTYMEASYVDQVSKEEVGVRQRELLMSGFPREMSYQIVISAASVRNALFIEILGALFRINKHLIPTDIKFDFHEIIDIGNWEDFIEYSYAKYVNTMAWRGGLESQLKFFSSSVNAPITMPSDDLELCHQTEAFRHALVHGSTVNETLLRRIGSTELNLGDRIVFSPDHLGRMFAANIRLLNEMTKSAMQYLGVPGAVLSYTYEPGDE